MSDKHHTPKNQDAYIESLEARIAELEAEVRQLRTETTHAAPDAPLNGDMLEQLLHLIPDVIYIYDLEKEANLYSSRQMLDLLGYTPEQVQQLPTPLLDYLIHPEDSDIHTAYRERLMQVVDDEIESYELRFRHADGSWRWFYGRDLIYTRYSDGTPRQLLGIAHDITARKQAEETLRHSEQYFRTLAENSTDVIARFDTALRFTYVNPALTEAHNVDESTFIGKTNAEVTNNLGADLQMSQHSDENLQGVLDSRQTITYEVQVSETAIFEVRAIPELDAKGQVKSILTISRDITTHKRTEYALRQSEHHFRTLAENIPDSISRLDSDLRYLYVNPALAALFNRKQEEFYGKTNVELAEAFETDIDLARYMDEHLSLIVETGESLHFEKVADSGGRTLEVRAFPEFDAEGAVESIVTMTRDVTQQRRNRDQLEFQANVLDQILDAVIAIDGNYQVSYLNRAAAEQYGISQTGSIGKLLTDLYDVEFLTPEGLQQSIAEIQATGKWRGEVIHIKQNGERIYVDASTAMLKDADGNLVGILAVLRDVTVRKQTENLYRALVEQSLFGMSVIISSERFAFVNERFAEMLGRTVDEILQLEGDGIWSFIHPDDVDMVRERFKQRREGVSVPARYIYRVVRPSGEVRWLEIYVTLIDYEGQIASHASYVDITEQKRAEAALEEQQTIIARIAEVAPYVMYIYDRYERRDVFAGKHVFEFFGLHPDDIDKLDFEFIKSRYHPDDISISEQAFSDLETAAPGTILNYDLRIRNHANQWRWMRFWVTPFNHHADGKVQQVLGIGIDVTEAKTAEEQALQLTLQRERVRVITDFIRDAAHEFRTPLSSINTATYMLRRTGIQEKQERYVDSVDYQSEQILKLVEALLTISRLNNNVEIVHKRIMLADIVDNLRVWLMSLTEHKPMQVSFTVEPSLPHIYGDPPHLLDALKHLVDNAVRYTPENGSIQVSVKQVKEEILFSITDTGSGIPEDIQAQVFDHFFRQDSARSTRGFGLGLTIARTIIERHNGRIVLDSQPQQGTTMWVHLPLKISVPIS